MAENKNWRDYSKYNSSDKSNKQSENSEKTGSWRDYTSDKSTSSGNSSGGWRSYSNLDTGTIVGNNIANRVNTWLEKHNLLISDYQKRYSDRKYSYEDSYVSDSGSWLDIVSKQKSDFDTEADSILSYMEQYKGYLNEDWMKSVRDTLTGARDTQNLIVENSTKDNQWWSNFGSEELVQQYGSAEKAYKYYQRSDGYEKKYTGLTSDELYKLVGNMDDGEEKDWLTSYASSVDYNEKSKADLNAIAKEIEDLGNFYDAAYTISHWYNDYKSGRVPYDAHKLEIYNRLVKEYDGDIKKLHSDIKRKEAYMTEAQKIQDLISMSSVTGREDFADKSKYVNNVKYGLFGKPEFTDNTYAYINNPTVEDKRPLGVGEATARELIDFEHSAYTWDTPTRNRDSSYARDALDYIKPEEIAIYNYYYATEGAEKANEYLDLLINTFKARKDAQTVENASKFANDHPFLSSVLSVGTSIGSGFEYIGDVIEYGGDKLFGKDAELGTNESALVTNAVRGTVADKVDWEIGNWDAFDFLYNTTMSGVDSLASTAFGGLGGTVLGLSAAAQGTNDALMRGMSDGQAFWNGLFSGVFEGVFETISIGNFNALKNTAINVGLKNIDKTIVKEITKNIGKSMLVNASEEMLTEIANITYDTLVNGEFANYTLEELENGAWKKALNQVIESGASGALMGMGMSAVGSSIGHAKGVKKANEYAVKHYGGQNDAIIQEGLESDIKSDSYKFATKYQQQVQGKDGKQGKTLTGQQIRNLLAANQEQITPKDLKKIQQAAEARLTELGQTEDVSKLAELATKYVTGQKMSKAEKAFLANNKNGNRVAQEALPENIITGDYTSGWAEGIGTQKVNAGVYNIKAILEKIANMDNPATYKSLDKRVSEEDKFSVSKSGTATISKTNEAIDLSKPEIVDFVRDKESGKVTDMILNVNGKQVKASEIDFADADQSYLFSAVKHIENITPGDATVFVRDYDPASGLSVGEYLNGIDEGYTYGYYRYTEADLGAGQFAPKLSSEQAKGAYLMGQTTRESRDTKKSETIKRMRTAVEAEAEKAKAEGKPSPKSKKMTITYNAGSGKIVDFRKSGVELTDRNEAAVRVAKFLHKLGLGTNFEFFASEESKTLKVKDKETGEEVAARVFIDEYGNEQLAPAGVYRLADGTIRVDLNAYNGRQFALNALAHELTHFIQQWSDEKYKVLAEFLVKTYEKTDLTMHQRVTRWQKRLSEIRGEEVSYNEAYDEVVANAMSKMFDDGRLLERLTELKAKDEKLARKLWEGIKNILGKLLGVYQADPGLFRDAKDLWKLKEDFEKLQDIFAEALVEASDNFQAYLTASESQTLTEAGFGFDESTKSMYSLNFSTAYKDEIQVGKKTFDAEAIAQLASKVTGRSIEDARKWVRSEMAIANIVMQNPEFLDFEADNRYDAIKKNSDYPQGTVDLSNLCPKREEFTAIFDLLQKKYPNKLFTAQDVAEMRKILAENGITVACGACFVEDRRQLIGEIADTFIGMWKEAAESGKPLQKTNAAGNKVELLVTKALAKQYGLTPGTKIKATDTYIPNQYDLTTYEDFKLLEKNHPTIAMAFNRYNNSRGQQSARLIEGRAEYKRQILGWSDAKVRSVNNNGGLRIFSFSDFEVVHLLDLVQVIIDCAAKGVKIQGYTKIPAFAKLVRGTGIKLNRSLIPMGDYGYHMENGKVVLDYDTTEGIDINDDNFIDESNNPNVGNIVIGINPTQIGAAMLDSFIDYIIPFHSNKAKEILKKLGTGEWVNYKESQHEKDISTGKASKHNVNIYTEVINKYHPTNKVEFVEAFLKECKRQGKIPRYAEFLNVDSNGDYAYREGYHKLLVDFKMFDSDGNILPQGNITPNLEEAFMKDLLNAEIDKKQNYEFPQEVYDAIDKKFGEQYSSQETDADKKETEQEDKTNVRREEVSHRGNVESSGKVGKENSGRESSERERCEGRIKEILRRKVLGTNKAGASGRGRVETKETRADFESRVRNDGLMYVETGRNALAFKVATAQNENASIAASTLRKFGFDVIVFHGNLQRNGKGVTETSDAGTAVRSAGSLTIFISSELDIDGMETAYHEAFHAARYGMLAKYHEKIVDILASNVDVESESFTEFISIIADLYAYTESNVSASKFGAEIIEEFYAWYVGKAYATQSGDMQEYMAEFSNVESIKQQIDGVYAQMEANADKALPGLLEGQQFSSQETDQDGYTMSGRAKEILASAKPKGIGKNEKADIEFDTVVELFNELNADKDIQALAERVFKVAKEDVYGYYGYASYPGEPKSHLRLPMAFVGKNGIPDGVHGQFRKDTINGHIVFSYDYFMDDSVAPQSKASTILHEVIHAITCSHIETAYRWLQTTNGMFADPLAATDFDGIDERIKAGIELIDAFEQVRSAPTKDGKNLYGQLTAYEMVAEMANVEFRNFLKKQNLWSRIVEAIKRVLGIPNTTAYDAVSDALERILTETTNDADAQRAKIAARKANNRYSSQETDADNVPTFYSQMGKVVEGMKQEKFGASSVISMLRGRGVKAEEIHWSGIQAFLDGKKSVLKDGQELYSSQETDLDTDGKLLTKEQAEFFKDSVVRDKDGNLLVLYHGSSSSTKFTVFEHRPMVNGKVYGDGYYFTEVKNEASKWGSGNIYKVYVDLKNPYYVSSKEEAPEAIVAIAKEKYGRTYDRMSQDPNWWGSKLTREAYIEQNSRMWANADIALISAVDESGIPDGTEAEYYGEIARRKTELLRSLGYDGVIVTTGRSNRNFQEVMAFDSEQIKLTTNKKPTSNPDMRYSTQETDNISNRDMLANAFETLSQSSDEYKMIQEYRGRIKILNEYEAKLAKLNAEITKMLFDPNTERDAKKLKELQKEAKEVAGHINRNDKKLLSMEASEPLRKVIEAERKKASQKTKDHIKEIQKNKKARAEQTELRHKIRKAVRDLDKLLNRGNKKLNVKEDMKGFVSKALEMADYLFTDHISNDELIRKGITVRMTPQEAKLVKETEDILSKLYDEADSLTDEEFTRLDVKRKANEEKLRELLKDQRNEKLSTPVYQLFDDLVTEYASLKNSSQDSVKAAYNDEVERLLRTFIGDADSDRAKALKNMRVADMTTEELWKLYNAYTMVLTTVRDANKFHVQGISETIEQVVGQIAGDFGSRKIPDKKLAIAVQKFVNKLGWDYEKLYYALDRIGSEAFTKLIMNLANAENTVMQDIIEAAAFRDQIVEKYGFNNWDVNKEIDREFLDNTGKKFKMTLGQLMSLYAYSRREGAWDHIEYGGFVFGEAALTNPRPADSYKLSKEQCEAITSLLSKEQKGYVEDMQKFLSETMGAKGNEVSMLLYGIKMFGEKNYFPIHIAGQFKAQAQEAQAKQAAGFGSMSNAGFTHAQNPNAKAPFVLEGFNEVWADHVNEMSRYHGTVPALEDLRRVMNRSTYSNAVSESQSIKQLMENSFGKEAVDYFDNLYREANSGAITDKLQKKSKKLLSLFRKNSVAYSLSVLIQQPASLVRAYAMIDRKYFGAKGFGAITSGVAKAVSDKWTKAHTNAYNEMLKYAPGVTMAKEIGGFDTHTGGSIRSYLLDTNKSLKQKWKTGTAKEKGKAVLDLVDDNAVANLPNMADKIAWIEIWNACKREAVATHKDLAPSSEEFMKAVGERFTEVIRATQVYDSIFAKSPILKSKNLAVQYLVSFMNEPNTVANMAEKAVRDATKGDWKNGARTAAVVIHSIIFTNMLKSIIYAMRDDDEDETYIEKYIEAVTGNMMNDFNPLNYIPIARDAWSIAQGYDVERADMAIVADALDALDRVLRNAATETEGMTEDELIEFDKKVTEANWKLVESVASFFGIPVKNIRREIMGVINHARIASTNAGQTTAQSAWDKVYDAVVGSIPFMSTPSKQDKLYDAIISGDTQYVNRLKSTYKSESAYQSAVRKALRENDSRIQKAAQARYEGNTVEYKRIFREIQNEGKFSFDDIMSAINTELSKLTPDKITSQYSASGFVEAVLLGDMGKAEAMRDDIIATHVANGKTQKEAEEAFVSAVATGIREAYFSGLLNAAKVEKMLMEYAGKDEEDATSRVSYWAFCEKYPKYDYLSESNVNDYKGFAEPENISLEVFAQYINGTKGLTDIKDKWGDVEVTKREQVLEVIDSLDLTWKQKDALYLAAGYSESKIWDVPW